MAKFLLFTGFMFSFYSSTAQTGKIDTDRPDQTESAATVPRNYFQAEIGFNKENTFYKNYDLVYPTALLKYGLNKFEFRIETSLRSSYEHLIPDPKWTNGFAPVEIGLKAALLEEKTIFPKTSLLLHLGIPALSSKAFHSDHLAPSFKLLLQKSLTNFLGLGSNLGAEWDGFTPTPVWLYTFSPGFTMGKNWYAYIEAFGFIQKNELPQHSIDGGLAYYINNNIKIDISSGFGLTKATPKNYVAIGFSFRFKT